MKYLITGGSAVVKKLFVSADGQLVDVKQIVCGEVLAGIGNSLVKTQQSRKPKS